MIHSINSLRNLPDNDSYEPISTVDYNWDISDGDFEGDSLEKQSDLFTVQARTKRILILAATVLSGIVVLLVSRILTSV